MPTLQVQDAVLNYQCLGQGEDVVFIHGLGANLAFWYMGIAKHLATRYRVITYDLRGHGRSSLPPLGYTLPHMARDLKDLLDNLGVAKAHIVGHSFGARVALYFAIVHPERVRSLTVADTQVRSLQPEVRLRDWPYWPQWKAQLREQGHDNLPDDDEIISFRLLASFNQHSPGLAHTGAASMRRGPSLRNRDMGRKGSARWEQLMASRAAVELDQDHQITPEAVSQIRVPTLAVFGEYSHCLGTCWRLQELLPDSQVVIIPKAGHFHPAIRPRTFAAVLRRFLARNRYGRHTGTARPTTLHVH